MKPHPKIRKTIKWGGAAVTVLLVGVWIGSGWFDVMWMLPPWQGWLSIGRGSVEMYHGRMGGTLGLGYLSADGEWYVLSSSHPSWTFELPWFKPANWGGLTPIPYVPTWSINVPLWMLPATSSLVAALGWRLDTLARRRERLNLCPKCNYDRAGIGADAVCPECGCGGVTA